MAEVKLGRLEAEEGELPPLCLRCGQPAVVYKRRKLAGQPAWTYPLLLFMIWPFLIVSLLVRRRIRVLAPLCSTHQYYWRRRRRIAIAATIIYALLMVLVFLLCLNADANSGPFGSLWFVFWVAGVLLLLLVYLVRYHGICVTDITEESVTLTGISPIFVARLHAERQQPPSGIAGTDATRGAKAAPKNAALHRTNQP